MTTKGSESVAGAPAVFATTQWTRVLEARGESPEAKAALSDLCAAYYAPVFAYIRHNTRDEESARDSTQEFFRRLLSRQGIEVNEINDLREARKRGLMRRNSPPYFYDRSKSWG